MIEVLRSDDGDILAACEWDRRKTDGSLDKNGDVIFVKEVVSSRGVTGVVRWLLRAFRREEFAGIRYVVWSRGYKYPRRRQVVRRASMLLRRTGG